MGIKNVFKRPEPTEAELRNDLNELGISTRPSNKREQKFAAFGDYANQRRHQKSSFKPVNPYANLNEGGNGGNSNPYASNSGMDSNSNFNNSNAPYGQDQGTDAYANSYGSHTGSRRSNSNAKGTSNNPYNSFPSSYDASEHRGSSSKQPFDPYAKNISTAASSRRPRDFDEDTLDLNAIPTNPMYSSKPVRKPVANDTETIDLNELPEDDLNVPLDMLPEEQVNSEDEEVESLKQNIRFVKKESLNSTRNTLRMAQEADTSAINTLGVLGSQSERLYNAEQNLLLADTQTGIAAEKVKELQRLNRSIFIPAYGNPFNKKSRLQQEEMKLKSDKAQEKYLRDTNRKEMLESERRIKEGLSQNATSSDLHQKYQNKKHLEAAKRYQFEADSEDDEIEKELANNLEEISLYTKKLRSSAQTMGVEVDSQNKRLAKIEDDADRLDINVHMNSVRLSNIH